MLILKNTPRIIFPYEKTLIILTTHFLENLKGRFPDIKRKRVENAIKRKIDNNEIPMDKIIAIKLMRQKYNKYGKNPRKLRPAFVLIEKIKARPNQGINTVVSAITIREIHRNSEKNFTILQEN